MTTSRYEISKEKVKNLVDKLIKLKDDKTLSPVDAVKRDTVLKILSTDTIDFKALSFSDDCPPKYLSNSIMLCKYIDGYMPCEECWKLNLSNQKEHSVTDDKDVIRDESYNTLEKIKKLEDYESTNLSPEQIKATLVKLEWQGAINNFDDLLLWLDDFNPSNKTKGQVFKEPKSMSKNMFDVDDSSPDVENDNNLDDELNKDNKKEIKKEEVRPFEFDITSYMSSISKNTNFSIKSENNNANDNPDKEDAIKNNTKTSAKDNAKDTDNNALDNKKSNETKKTKTKEENNTDDDDDNQNEDINNNTTNEEYEDTSIDGKSVSDLNDEDEAMLGEGMASLLDDDDEDED